MDDGRDIRWEIICNQVRMIRCRVVTNFSEGVLVGIAKSGEQIGEFGAAGGNRPDNQEMKADLNAILPAKLSELLCIEQSDPKMSYESFKSSVERQTSQILMNSGRLAVNVVDNKDLEHPASSDGEDNGDDERGFMSEPIDMVQRNKSGGRF